MEWGSILSGIGRIAGSGIFGGGSDGIDVSENVRLNKALMDLQPRSIDRKVAGVTQAARKHGYHPMYLMGSAGNYSPQVIASGAKRGTDYGAIGRGAADLAEGLKKREQDPTAKAMTALGLREATASAEQAEIQTELLRLQLDREREGVNAQPTKGARTFAADKPHQQMFIGADGVARPITRPMLSEEGEPHYGEGMDLEAGIMWLQDRGIPMAKEWASKAWKTSNTKYEFGRILDQVHAEFKRSQTRKYRDRYNWPKLWME